MDLYLPESLRRLDETASAVRPVAQPLPLAHVRLVAALTHSDDGSRRDVIVDAIALRRRTFAQMRGDDPPERTIAGVAPPVVLPYADTEKEPDYDEPEGDTFRIEVEERTFAPSLRAPPMPAGLIDELRGRYSRFRTRHDDAYVRGKEEEAQREQVRKEASAQRMVTPLQEWRVKRRQERRARGWPGLDQDALERIGETMQRNLKITEVKGPAKQLLESSNAE